MSSTSSSWSAGFMDRPMSSPTPTAGRAGLSPSASMSASPEPSDPGDVPPPKIAWREGAEEEDEGAPELEEDLAAQIRRDWLAKRILEGLSEPPSKQDGTWQNGGAPEGPTEHAEPSSGSPRFQLKTPEARKSLQDLEHDLKQKSAVAARQRDELNGYVDALRKRTFASQPDSDDEGTAGGTSKEEPLVLLPREFDEIVDMNAQISASRRASTKKSQGRGSMPRGQARGALPNADEGTGQLKLPGFLEKYFNDDIAAQQIPLLQLEDRLAPQKTTKKELDGMAKELQKIARLDGLLAKCEAEGSARVRAAQIDLDMTRERIRRESLDAQEEKVRMLERLKERGLLRKSNNTSRAPSGRNTAAPSTICSARSSVAGSSASSVLAIPTEPDFMDWSGWTSTAVVAPVPEDQQLLEHEAEESHDSRPGTAASSAFDPAEPDTSTFDLTSITSNLARGSAPSAQVRAPSPSQSQIVVSKSSCHDVLATVEEEAEAEHALVVVDDAAFMPEDASQLEALQRIDEKLRSLVPEQEWEEKSISSYARGSAMDKDEVASRRAGSVWSSQLGEALADDPNVRQQYEAKEGERALADIEERLWELRLAEPAGFDPLRGGQVRQLLMQAASESQPLDSTSRVMALSNFSAKPSATIQDLVPAGHTDRTLEFPESAYLRQARSILEKLEEDAATWEDACFDAERLIDRAEDDVRFVDTKASEGTEEASSVPDDGVRQFEDGLLTRLQNLGGQLAGVLDRPDPFAQLPQLTGAARLDEDVPDDESLDDDIDIDDPLTTHSASTDPQPLPADGPNPALLRALDLELPPSSGAWDDATLEQVVRAMDAHFGDAPLQNTG